MRIVLALCGAALVAGCSSVPAVQKVESNTACDYALMQRIEGSWQPKRLVILEFPSLEKAKAWWASSDYAEGKKLRQSCAKTAMVVVEGA